MRILQFISLIFFSLILVNCSDSDFEFDQQDADVTSFNAYNHTGHLVRRSGIGCGIGIKVAFVLSSSRDRKEYIFEANSFGPVTLDIEKGEAITVQAYQVNGEDRLLLTQNSTMYDPEDDEDRKVIPEIVLCPKDHIEFYDFN